MLFNQSVMLNTGLHSLVTWPAMCPSTPGSSGAENHYFETVNFS